MQPEGCHLGWGHQEHPLSMWLSPFPPESVQHPDRGDANPPKLSWSPSKTLARGRTDAQPAPPAPGGLVHGRLRFHRTPLSPQQPVTKITRDCELCVRSQHGSSRGRSQIPEEQRQADFFPL